MHEVKVEEKVQIQDEGGEPAPARREPDPSATAKPGPGRPKKNEQRDPHEPPPRPRKPAEEITDPRGAILVSIDRLAVLTASYGATHPESDLQWIWKRIREALPAERSRVGAPVDRSAFAPPVRGICRGAEWLGGLPTEEQATSEEIEDVANSWGAASKHLGLTESFAAVATATSKTVGLVGRQIGRAVTRAIVGEPSAPELPMERTPPAQDEAPTREPETERCVIGGSHD